MLYLKRRIVKLNGFSYRIYPTILEEINWNYTVVYVANMQRSSRNRNIKAGVAAERSEGSLILQLRELLCIFAVFLPITDRRAWIIANL